MGRNQNGREVRATPRPDCSVISEVGLLARRALCGGRRGRIAAVFERSFYAAFDDDWVCVGVNGIGSGPLHVLYNGIVPLALSPGQEIVVADGMISVGGLALADLDVARTWRPEAPPRWTRETLHAGLLAADALWHVAPEEQGLASAGFAQRTGPQSRVLVAAAPGLEALARLIEAGRRGQRASPHDAGLVADLIGLGPGLTPSGDDLLGGAMAALASLGLFETRDALWDALRAHLLRTNDISAAHLRSGALGYVAAALHAAINATMAGQVDRIGPALVAVSSIGHSSGQDAFAGALIVFRAVSRQMLLDQLPGSAVAAA